MDPHDGPDDAARPTFPPGSPPPLPDAATASAYPPASPVSPLPPPPAPAFLTGPPPSPLTPAYGGFTTGQPGAGQPGAWQPAARQHAGASSTGSTASGAPLTRSTEPRPRSRRRRTWTIVGAFTALSLVLTTVGLALAGILPNLTDPAADAGPTTGPSGSPSAQPSATPSAPPGYATATVAVGEEYSGVGDTVVTVRHPYRYWLVVNIDYTGTDHMLLTREDTLDSLAAQHGDLHGTYPFNIFLGTEDATSVTIHGDGAWTVSFTHLADQPFWDADHEHAGEGAEVLQVDPPRHDVKVALHTGASEFLWVIAIGELTSYDVLTRQGPITTTGTVPADVIMLIVDTPGDWSIAPAD